MTSKKWAVIISGIIAIVSIAGFIFLEFRLYSGVYQILSGLVNDKNLLIQLKDFGLNISNGLFTGAFVTFLIAIKDYQAERKKSLERIYLASEDLQHVFAQVKYILPEEPRELIKELFGEIDGNEKLQEHNQHVSECMQKFGSSEGLEHYSEIPLMHKAEERFKTYIYNVVFATDKKFKINITEEEKDKYINRLCDEKIKKYAEQIEEVVRSYLSFNSVRTQELSNAYGELDFIFPSANKCIRNHIYINLYRKQIDQISAIKDINYHFNLYVEGKGGSRSVILDFIWKLQDMLVSEEQNFYYRKYMFDVETQMVQTLLYANGKKNKDEFPEKKEYMIVTKPKYMEHILNDSDK